MFDFDSLAPVEIPFTYAGKRYILREATEAAACKYKNALLRVARFSQDGGATQIGEIAEADPVLLSACLFEQYEHQGQVKERPVLLATIMAWPRRVSRPLIEKLKEISELEEQETREVLEKRLRETQKKLTELLLNKRKQVASAQNLASTDTGDPAKNEQGCGQDTSGLPTS